MQDRHEPGEGLPDARVAKRAGVVVASGTRSIPSHPLPPQFLPSTPSTTNLTTSDLSLGASYAAVVGHFASTLPAWARTPCPSTRDQSQPTQSLPTQRAHNDTRSHRQHTYSDLPSLSINHLHIQRIKPHTKSIMDPQQTVQPAACPVAPTRFTQTNTPHLSAPYPDLLASFTWSTLHYTLQSSTHTNSVPPHHTHSPV